MKTLLTVIFIFASGLVSAAVPSMEGLFRNGDNVDLEGELFQLRFIVEERVNDKVIEKYKAEGNDLKLQELMAVNPMTPRGVEMFLVQNGTKDFDVIMNEYTSTSFTNDSLVNSQVIRRINNHVKKDSVLGRNMLYSVVMMLGLNDSEPLISLIKSYNKDFELNREVLNYEKVNLLKKYSTYLEAVKEDKSAKDSLENPMNPENEAQKKRVAQVRKERMYRTTDNVKLIRENGLFFWSIDLDGFQARFSNKSHHLDFLKLSVGDGQFEVNCSDYVLFNGKYTMPRFFMMKADNDRLYKVSFTMMKSFQKNSMTLNKRHAEIQKNIPAGAKSTLLPNDVIY